jgi:hypothetical protein
MFDAELAKLARIASIVSSAPFRTMLQEVCPLAQKVGNWASVSTSGFVICRYNTVTNDPLSYDVTAQSGNMGKLVHELTHVAVNEAYKHDFVNYPHRTAQNVPPRTYDPQGRCTNEFDRQTKYMDDTSNSKLSGILLQLTSRANASELPLDKKTAVTSKLNYGMQWPLKEYDTVINQVLVWLYEWGYPIKSDKKFKKEPVVNTLFEEVERAVDQANQLRLAGP